MDYACGMHVLEAAQDLVQEVLDKLFLQGPRLQQTVKIRALKLGDKVNVLQRRQEDVLEANEVFVSEMLEKLELTVRAFGENRSGERLHDFFDGDGLVGVGIGGRANQAKGAHTDWVELCVPVCDLEDGSEDLSSDELFLSSHCTLQFVCGGGCGGRGFERLRRRFSSGREKEGGEREKRERRVRCHCGRASERARRGGHVRKPRVCGLLTSAGPMGRSAG